MTYWRTWVLNNCFSKSGRELLPSSHIIKKDGYSDFEKFVANLPSEYSPKLKCLYVLHGYNTLRSCAVCGNPIYDTNDTMKMFCSRGCSAKHNRLNDVIKQKRKETCLQKYGTPTPFHSSDIQQKIKNSVKDKYGVNNISQLDVVKTKKIESYKQTMQGKAEEINEKYKERRIKIYERWNQCKDIGVISSEFGISYHHVYKVLNRYGVDFSGSVNKSSYEDSFVAYIKSIYDGVVLTNVRDIIPPKEIDIYLPEKKIAIEVNGLFWHSENSFKHVNKSYHKDKTDACERKGIQLFHVFDSDNIDIWKSIIQNALGMCDNKIGARQCQVRYVPGREEKLFLQENHMQGYCRSKFSYGLYYNDELVSLMTFGKARFNKRFEWELLRFCSKKGYVVVGAASKLLSAFRSENKKSIISYANRRWSNGKLYETLGFTRIDITSPNYFYWNKKEDTCRLYSRNRFQKKRLAAQLQKYDPKLSEWENMRANGYDRIWDSGNIVYAIL